MLAAFIEGMAGLWCASLGFNHPRLAKAGAAQLEKLAFYHTFAHRTTDIASDLAARLDNGAERPASRLP